MDVSFPPPALAVGSMIRELRKQAFVSGRQLARRCEISQAKISKIETGKSWPTIEDVHRICVALNAGEQVHRRLSRLVKESNERLATRRHNMFFEYRDVELKATQLDFLVVTDFHSLLQTREYASDVVLRDSIERDQLPHALQARAERQAQLNNPAKRFRFLLSSRVLGQFRIYGDVWTRQIEHVSRLVGSGTKIREFDDTQAILRGCFEDIATLDGRSFHDLPFFKAEYLGDEISRRMRTTFDRLWRNATPLTVDRLQALVDGGGDDSSRAPATVSVAD